MKKIFTLGRVMVGCVMAVDFSKNFYVAVTGLLLNVNLEKKRTLPPEYIGALTGYKDKIINVLAKKNIIFSITKNTI